jgi:hypothetical protein
MKTKIPNYFKLTKTFLIVTLCLALSLPPYGFNQAQAAPADAGQAKSLDSQRIANYRQVIRGYLQEIVQLCNNPHPAVREYVAEQARVVAAGLAPNELAAAKKELSDGIKQADREFIAKQNTWKGKKGEIIPFFVGLGKPSEVWQAKTQAYSPYPRERDATSGRYIRNQVPALNYHAALLARNNAIVVSLQKYLAKVLSCSQKELQLASGQKAQKELFTRAKALAEYCWGLTYSIPEFEANYRQYNYERNDALYAEYMAYCDTIYSSFKQNFTVVPWGYGNQWADFARTSFKHFDYQMNHDGQVKSGSIRLDFETWTFIAPIYDVGSIIRRLDSYCATHPEEFSPQQRQQHVKEMTVYLQGYNNYYQAREKALKDLIEGLNEALECYQKVLPYDKPYRLTIATTRNDGSAVEPFVIKNGDYFGAFQARAPGLTPWDESCDSSSFGYGFCSWQILNAMGNFAYYDEMCSPAEQPPTLELKDYSELPKEEQAFFDQNNLKLTIPEKITLKPPKSKIKLLPEDSLSYRWVITNIPETEEAKSQRYVLYQTISKEEIAEFQPDLAGNWEITLELNGKTGYFKQVISDLTGRQQINESGKLKISVNAFRRILWIYYKEEEQYLKKHFPFVGAPYYLEVTPLHIGIYRNYSDAGCPVDLDDTYGGPMKPPSMRFAVRMEFRGLYNGEDGSGFFNESGASLNDIYTPLNSTNNPIIVNAVSASDMLGINEAELLVGPPRAPWALTLNDKNEMYYNHWFTEFVVPSADCIYGQKTDESTTSWFFSLPIKQWFDREVALNLDGKGFKVFKKGKLKVGTAVGGLGKYLGLGDFGDLNCPDWLEAETVDALKGTLLEEYVERINTIAIRNQLGLYRRGTKYIMLNPYIEGMRLNLPIRSIYASILPAGTDGAGLHEAFHSYREHYRAVDADRDGLPGETGPALGYMPGFVYDYIYDSPANAYIGYGAEPIAFFPESVGTKELIPIAFRYLGDRVADKDKGREKHFTVRLGFDTQTMRFVKDANTDKRVRLGQDSDGNQIINVDLPPIPIVAANIEFAFVGSTPGSTKSFLRAVAPLNENVGIKWCQTAKGIMVWLEVTIKPGAIQKLQKSLSGSKIDTVIIVLRLLFAHNPEEYDACRVGRGILQGWMSAGELGYDG